MASAIHGAHRSTQDVDFVADLKEEHIDDLVAALEGEFQGQRHKNSINKESFDT
ncbi:MAG TPA: hypothetical protein VIM99_18575 [Blastocatellia bacterium]